MARLTASERARRLIAMLGQFEKGTRIPLAVLAQRLGTTEDELAADLETLSLCGVAPYSPDQLVDVFIEDGVVEVFSPLPAIEGAVRLSVAEARALAAALQAAGYSAEDPLVVRLLDAAGGREFDAAELERTLRAAVRPHESAVYATLADAVSQREAVRIEYRGATAGAGAGVAGATERVIEPAALFAERGAWYVLAHCRLAGGERTFRLDRIASAEPTGERFESAAHGAGDRAATAGFSAFDPTGLPTAMLAFDAAERFVAREWPGARVVAEEPDRTLVEVPYAGTSWIARQVAARLGSVEVIAPAEVRAAVARVARAGAAS